MGLQTGTGDGVGACASSDEGETGVKQGFLFEMVTHYRCSGCGCVEPTWEFVSIDFTLEDDEPYDPALADWKKCRHCGKGITNKTEPYAFPTEVYAPPCVGSGKNESKGS